jgi:hypothetical protein
VFENRVLRRIFGPKRYEVTGEWRELLNNLYYSPGIIRMESTRIRLARQVARMGRKRTAYKKVKMKETGWKKKT